MTEYDAGKKKVRNYSSVKESIDIEKHQLANYITRVKRMCVGNREVRKKNVVVNSNRLCVS